MPHASLLGSNGHHCAFTSQMISGHINVFIVLQEVVGGEGGGWGVRKTEKHKDTLHTHACKCISVRTVL